MIALNEYDDYNRKSQKLPGLFCNGQLQVCVLKVELGEDSLVSQLVKE